MEANLGFPAENYVRDRCSRKVYIIIINENYEKVTWFLTSRKRRTHTHIIYGQETFCLGGAQGIRQMPTHMFQYRPRLTSPAMLPHQSNSKFRVSVEQTSGDVRWLYNNRSHQLFSARSTAHSVCTRWVSFSIFFSPFFLAHIFLPILHGPNAHPGPSISFHEGWGQVILCYLLVLWLFWNINVWWILCWTPLNPDAPLGSPGTSGSTMFWTSWRPLRSWVSSVGLRSCWREDT